MKLLRPSALLVVLGAQAASAQPPPPEAPPGAPAVSGSASAATIDVSGRVINALGRPVSGAKVSVSGSDDRVLTDSDGRFALPAPVGATLLIESPRYNLGIAIVAGESVDDVVLLTEQQAGETIEVSGEAPAPSPGAASIDRTELQRIPGAGGDLVRALTIMPGVVNLQLPIGYSGVVIRGSSPQDSKVFVDDFEIPILFHNIGFRALVPAESIASLDYIPGGFDVAFGRASSGIVALSTRNGADKRSAQAEVSVVDGGLTAQGPAGEDTRYLVALRRSTIDFVLPSIIPEDVNLSLTTVPSYWDGQLRVDHRLSSKWRLMLSSLGTDDVFELYTTKNEEAADKRFFNRTRFIRTTAAARYQSGGWSANLALSGILTEFTFELGRFQFIRVTQPQVTPRFEITRTAKEAAGLTNVVWRVGGETQVGRSRIDIALPLEPREGEPQPEIDPEDTSTRFTGVVWTPNYAAWTALSANLDPRIRATVGVRAEYFARPEEAAIQPRAEVQVKLARDWTARVSSGMFRRPPEFQSELLEKQLKSERSTQSIAGLQWEPTEGIRAQLSGYYYDRSALITRRDDQMLGNNGRGHTVGAELLGTYRSGPWFGWLSYSYSSSKRVDNPGGMERLFSFDQPHSMNAAASWKRGKWQLGGRFQLYSGLPYTPAIGSIFDSDRNLYVPIYADANSERAPIHHQLDLRIDRSWRWGPVQMTGFLDVQNVYLNDSVVTYFYSFDYSQRTAFKSLPLIPSLGLRGVL
jgi:hypothetical protein